MVKRKENIFTAEIVGALVTEYLYAPMPYGIKLSLAELRRLAEIRLERIPDHVRRIEEGTL